MMIGTGTKSQDSIDQWSSSDYDRSADLINPVTRREQTQYFVQIQIEETFLRWLGEPDFLEPCQVIENLTAFIHNQVFVQHVLIKELKMRRKTKRHSSKLLRSEMTILDKTHDAEIATE